jgi:hypothetical protein
MVFCILQDETSKAENVVVETRTNNTKKAMIFFNFPWCFLFMECVTWLTHKYLMHGFVVFS